MDDDDFRSADGGSQDGGSDNEMDETMRDADGDDDIDIDDNDNDNEDGDDGDEGDGDADDNAEGDVDGDVDGDGDGDGENDENAADSNRIDADQQHKMNGPDASQQGENSKAADLSHPRPEVLTALTYDIVPTIAAPQSTSINAVCGTADSRWIFTGGADGYIRQYNWIDSVNGKTLLTVAQRHPFVDSVVKAGVLMTYWENYDARKATPESTTQTTTTTLSPVYSLACQSQALWMVAGTASGAIRLQSVRHDEGHQIALLQKHTSAVSVLTLSSDETSLLSGSWDKTVVDWDLNTGQRKMDFAATGGQISCIESRPMSSVPVPYESGEVLKPDPTMSSNNDAALGTDGGAVGPVSPGEEKRANTPDSLFGDDGADDDLFGDNADANIDGNAFTFDDTAANQTLEESAAPEQGLDTDIDPIAATAPPVQPPGSPMKMETTEPELVTTNGVPNTAPQPLTNGLPHAEEMETGSQNEAQDDTKLPSTDTTFLVASTDGSIRVWDKRVQLPVARITPVDTPPWCLSAAWSPDGNAIYAGRRNNTVEEYDLRKGLKKPERVFRFQNGSGPVTSVKAMPNGRHLICASYDILRLYDLRHSAGNKTATPFLIVPGHRTGTISHLYLSADCRYMLSTGGNRGWEGSSSSEVLLGYEIGIPKSV